MVLLQCNVDVVESTFDWVKFIQDFAAVIVSIVALIVSYILNRQTLKTQREQNQRIFDAQKDVEARLVISKKLDEFYGPLLQLRMKSNLLYKKFSDKHRAANANFATLTYLLEGKTFEGNDKILLEAIINLGEECENLIHAKAGLIDDTELRESLIPRATTHFLILRLAYKGDLSGHAAEFKDLTFPKELDEKLEARKRQLEIDLANLNRRSS